MGLSEGELRVTDLVARVGGSQGNVSGHLACLKDCGMVTDRPEGRAVWYSIAEPEVVGVIRAAEALLARTGYPGRAVPELPAPVRSPAVSAERDIGAQPATGDLSVAVDRLRRRGLVLAGLTITWNVVEAVVAVTAGLAAGSIALVGFGFDSTIEVLSSSVVVWQFRAELRGGYDEARERRALRLIACTFFVLAGYVVFEAVRDLLVTGRGADESSVGIGLAALSLVVMPTLAWAKRRTATELGSPTLRADAAETMLCSWLSATLLAGLVVNATLGWWWADPAAAVVIAWLAAREGLEAWRGESCDDDCHEHDP